MAAEATLYLDQGSYWSRQLLWKGADGNPINLTGYTARMQVRHDIDATEKLLELTTGHGITLGGSAGTILLEISATDSAALPATTLKNKFVYDLEMVPANGNVHRLLEGKLIVSPEVTR